MSCEFSSERELPLKDRPFVGGELSTDLILLQKGGSIDHIVDKERVLQTGGSSKPPILKVLGFSAQ